MPSVQNDLDISYLLPTPCFVSLQVTEKLPVPSVESVAGDQLPPRTTSVVKVIGKKLPPCCACGLEDKTQPQFSRRYTTQKGDPSVGFFLS